MPKRKPRMTIAFVAEQLAAEFPACYAEFSDFMRKKRFIGLVNDAMSRGELPWFLHRGQRRIAPESLDGYVAAHGDTFARIAAESRAVLATPEGRKPVLERYAPEVPTLKAKRGRRPRAAPPREDMGPSLGEIE